jgi:hypothetical protein
VDVTITGGNNAGRNTTPQPSLYIFTKEHYSMMRVNGTDARPLWEQGTTRANVTDADLRSSFIPFVANTGTYSVKGSTLTYRSMVALIPNSMQPTEYTLEFRTEADTLWLTQRTKTEPIIETTWRLTRLE